MSAWLPAVLLLAVAWCTVVAGPDVLAVVQTSARAQEPSDLGTRAASAVGDENAGQGVDGTTSDGKPGVPRSQW